MEPPSFSLSAATGSATGAATASGAFPTAASLCTNWGGNRIGDHRRKPCAVVADGAGDRRPGRRRHCRQSFPPPPCLLPTGTVVGLAGSGFRGLGDFRGLSIAPPTGTAFSGAGTVANGCCRRSACPLRLGALLGNAAATGALQGIALSASLSSASGAASCSGALPDNFDHAVQWVSIYRRASQSRVRLCVLPCRNAARSRADCIDKLCGEDAVKTLTTNRLWVVNHIDNLLHKIEGNHHGR